MTKTVEAEAEVVLAFEPRKPGTRRRYTPEQKRLLLQEAALLAIRCLGQDTHAARAADGRWRAQVRRIASVTVGGDVRARGIRRGGGRAGAHRAVLPYGLVAGDPAAGTARRGPCERLARIRHGGAELFRSAV